MRGIQQTYSWGDGCVAHVLLQTPGLSVKRESIPPGSMEEMHLHQRAQQLFFVLKGTATLRIDDTTQVATEGASIYVPPGVKHFVANHTEDLLELLVISQPDTAGDRLNFKQTTGL